MTKDWRFIAYLIVGYLLFAEVASCFTASWPGDCLVGPVRATNNAQSECPTLASGTWLAIKYSDRFAVRHDKDIVALFTIVLGFSTVGLWWATVLLWKAAERSSQKQSDDMKQSIAAATSAANSAMASNSIAAQNAELELRAYVYLENAYFKFEVGRCQISFRIKNFGNTPAHDVRIRRKVEVLDWKKGDIYTAELGADEEEKLGSLAPNGDFVEFDDHYVAFSTVSLNKIVHLTGIITYRTVFPSETRISRFQYYIGGDAPVAPGVDGGEMMVAGAEWNDAT